MLAIGWMETERGNTWLTDGKGNHYALLRLEDESWIEVSIRQGNYPGLHVTGLSQSEEELAQHINTTFIGWFVRKCNIKGVLVDEGNNCVVEPEEDADGLS